MRRSSLLWLVLLGAAMPARASSWADSLFDDLGRDFGSVARGPVLVHHFRLTNKTRSPVHISNVRVSCGCVTAQAGQTTIEPGQETAIVVNMDTRRFLNSKTVTIYVQFDQPQFEEVRLWIQGNSRDDLAVLPESLAFGKIKRGAAPVTAVNLTFLGKGQTEIVKAHCESNYVKLAVKELQRNYSDVSYQISARLRADAPSGKWYSDVWLATNDPAVPKVRVPLTVEIEPPLVSVAGPQSVSMGMMKAGTQMERKVILRGAKPFRITSISGTDRQVSVRESTKQSRTVHVLTVTLRPTQPGMLNRTLRVHTDLNPGTETIDFQAKAQVVP